MWSDGAPDGWKSVFRDPPPDDDLSYTSTQTVIWAREEPRVTQNVLFLRDITRTLGDRKWIITWSAAWGVGATFSRLVREAVSPSERSLRGGEWQSCDGTDIMSLNSVSRQSYSHMDGRWPLTYDLKSFSSDRWMIRLTCCQRKLDSEESVRWKMCTGVLYLHTSGQQRQDSWGKKL